MSCLQQWRAAALPSQLISAFFVLGQSNHHDSTILFKEAATNSYAVFWKFLYFICMIFFFLVPGSVTLKVKSLFLLSLCRSWEESSTWMPSHSVCPRLHHEPEQAWKRVLQYRCGRFNFYGFKALPEPQTHWIRSTGNCLVSQRKKI